MIADASCSSGLRVSLVDRAVALQRSRLLFGAARLVAERGDAWTVADLAKTARASRTTIYKVFGSSDGIPRALLDAACPTLGDHFARVNLARSGLQLLAVELVASSYLGEKGLPAQLERAAADLRAVRDARLLSTRPKAVAGAIQGKHRLPRQLAKENQRRRLLLALAAEIAERGYKLSVADILTKAGVGRESFYEHFESKQSAIESLLAATVKLPTPVNLNFGLGRVVVEVVARRIAHEPGADGELLAEADWVIAEVRARSGLRARDR